VPDVVVIHIVGEVYNPGVFVLPAGSRVSHAVEAAGGYTADADLFRVNLAAPLADAMHIIVPAVGDYSAVPHIGGSTGFADGPGGLICINTATYSQLRTLNGIGTARANSIITHRENIGGFTSVEQLLDIPGIGSTILENIRPHITVRN
jgi:competence protein ComEA